ncbi:MAG: lysozyme [Bacteroidia bacterium]|nr:lysozyme [Bacteroidia bacterium]
MAEIKQMSENGLKFLMNNEGVILKPYLDTKGIPTIGVGNTYYEDYTKVKMTDPPITQARAMELFKFILRQFEMTVYSNTRDDINQNQFDSLTSLCYNIGQQAFKNSTLVKRINSRASDQSVKNAFLMWNKPAEIMKRRKREVELYFKA